MKRSVVVIDGDLRVLNYIRTILADRDCDVKTCNSGKQALECMGTRLHPKGVLVSTNLTDMHYADLIRYVRQLNPHISVAVMAYVDRVEDFMEAGRAGARHVLTKPFLAEDVVDTVAQLLDEGGIRLDNSGVEVCVGQNLTMVYASRRMHEIRQQAALVARVSLPVLLLGESGTGKEVIARYIHSMSRQAQHAFLKVNCAAVPSELLESELFGYEAGAFTGASRSKPGKFKLCDRGTMFLDEIGEMHPGLQAKLLQVLQDGTFSPLGGRSTEKVAVRILAATNIDVKEAIAKRTFREDLYYRLNGFCVNLPPLRERPEDIPVLLRHFMNRYSHELGCPDVQPSLSARLAKACLRHSWPGNLRELESFVKRYLVLGDEESMIDELTQEAAEENRRIEITPELIRQALNAARGNRRAAARSIGISYKVLLHRMRQFGMEPGPVELCAV